MVLPNFILAGAPKAGSSTFFEIIRQHPEIYMSEVKEPFFFDFNYQKGISWYEDFFKSHQGEKMIGEATVWYMRWPSVPQRIHQIIPNVKLLFILRNPIERAFSNYLMDLQGGHYTPDQTFGYVIRNEKQVPNLNRTIVSAGFYYEHLQRFEQYFDRSQMLVMLYDELKRDLRSVERRVYEFLGVDPRFQAKLARDYMVGSFLRNSELLSLASKSLPPFKLLWKNSRHFRSLFYKSFNSYAKRKRNVMSEPDRNYLRGVYAEPNRLLAEYLGCDLSHWQ